jgi:hypothetical protein
VFKALGPCSGLLGLEQEANRGKFSDSRLAGLMLPARKAKMDCEK